MSPDGGMVVAGGVTGALTVWNAEDGEHIATLKSGHSSAVVACSWGANDQLCSVEKVCVRARQRASLCPARRAVQTGA